MLLIVTRPLTTALFLPILTRGVLFSIIQISPVEAGVRVQPGNPTYLGHFKIPDVNGTCSDTPNARALGLTNENACLNSYE
jgi:hypothetical protein